MRKTVGKFGAALLIAAGAVSATAGTIDDARTSSTALAAANCPEAAS